MENSTTDTKLNAPQESTGNAVPNKDDKEEQKLQAMMGSSQTQEAKYVLNTKGEVVTFEDDSFKPQVTLYFKNCQDCTYVVNSMCTKVMIESCVNTKITFDKKIITNMIEVWKCEGVNLFVNTDIGTFQVDLCKNLAIQMKSMQMFKSLVWAGAHDLSLSFEDSTEHKLNTGFAQMQTQYPDLNEHTDQFIVRFIKGKLLTEQIVRLKNGYPTTEREAAEFDKRQEENLQKLAKEMGISIGKKKPTTPKLKPNEPCHCGSGKKFKKCHGQQVN